MEEEIITTLKKLIESYENINDSLSAVNEEIRMWRERYLSSLPNTDREQDAFIWYSFLAIPSSIMVRDGILKNMHNCQRAWEENN